MTEVVDGSVEETALDAELLFRAIKGRRTIRQFQRRNVEKDKIQKIIEAGRFTPTAGNRQALRYVVVQEKFAQFRPLVYNALYKLSDVYRSDPAATPVMLNYAERFIKLQEAFTSSKGAQDPVFFHAPAVIVITGETAIDGGLAASNMELMAFALGLGAMYCGFLVRAGNSDRKIREFLGIPQEEQLITSLVLGYSDVKYLRSVPRKKARVHYM